MGWKPFAALRGAPITEAARWEPDQWELFAGPGPDVRKEDVRAIPLGTLIGVDPSLDEVVRMDVGRALWRDVDDLKKWQIWK